MPRTSEAERTRRLNELADNQLILHMVDAVMSDVARKPLNEITDIGGEPTFLFQKRCHDEFRRLVREYSFLRPDGNLIQHYSDYAKAVLMERNRVRAGIADALEEDDLEHQDVTRVLSLERNAHAGRGISQNRAIRLVLRERRDRG